MDAMVVIPERLLLRFCKLTQMPRRLVDKWKIKISERDALDFFRRFHCR